MDRFESPSLDKKKNELSQIPPTPCLKKIGYGTGVHVYHWDRSTFEGLKCSPWALKKVYKQTMRANTAVPERMEEEASILKKLSHPNIVGFRGYRKSDGGRSVLAMEECGTSLGDLIEERRENEFGRFDADRICKVIISVSKALHYLHTEQRIIHGDIKSFNVLIKGDFEEIKLCDFGVSYPIDENGKVKSYVGTLCWSAPEVLNDGAITEKADIFAFGLTIWEMLTLQLPYNGDEAESDYSNITDSSFNTSALESSTDSVYGTRPPLPQDLPEEYDIVKEIFNWCTEMDYLKRPSAKDILTRLQVFTTS